MHVVPAAIEFDQLRRRHRRSQPPCVERWDHAVLVALHNQDWDVALAQLTPHRVIRIHGCARRGSPRPEVTAGASLFSAALTLTPQIVELLPAESGEVVERAHVRTFDARHPPVAELHARVELGGIRVGVSKRVTPEQPTVQAVEEDKA